MTELTGTIQNMSVDFGTDKMVLTLVLNERQSAVSMYEELKDAEKLSIKIGKHREKRSLDSNAYAWTLLGKLAKKLRLPKEEIYRNYIREIGGNSDIVCVQDKAVNKLRQGWSKNGLGWVTETMPSKLDGCTNVVLYYGSSIYDTEQMSRLIDLIVNDCKAQGIETKTPEEIAKMMTLWGERK
jgi:predicted lipase